MTYTLHSKDRTGGLAIEVGLALADAPFRIETVDVRAGDLQSEDYARLNPWRQIPTLVLPDGTVMTESAAMAIHLATAYPNGDVAPPPGTSDHARFLRWMVFMAVTVYEADLRYYYADRYTTDAETSGVRAAALERMTRAFETLEDALVPGPFLCGDRLGIVDAYLGMLWAWYPGELNAPRIQGVMTALRAHPFAGPIWTRHFPDA